MKGEIVTALLERIKQYDRIVLMRHKRPDGDALGATLGLRALLREAYPEKDVRVINEDRSEELAFLGSEDDEADASFYTDSLGILLDTATIERAANPRYQLCRELVRIDHHPVVEEYGDLSLVEPHRSSCCEIVAALSLSHPDVLPMNAEAARLLYVGMVTDSGRFRFESVTGDTLRVAAALLDFGIDTERMYAELYLREYHTLKFQAFVLENMKMTPNGVVYLHITEEMKRRFSLTEEQASASVIDLAGIRGSLVWFVCIDNTDGSSRVRLRSRFVTINALAERYHGGGHAHASGATVHGAKELAALVADADALLGEYKATHEGWL